MLKFSPSTTLCIEFGQSSFKLLEGTSGFELPIERFENGKLKNKEMLIDGVREHLSRHWRVRPQVICAIGARGVSVRRLTLPPATKDTFDQLLLFQIEKEFPLPPHELAWGCWNTGVAPSANGTRELTVIAVKRDILEDYAAVLVACDLKPVFTLSAAAASCLCPPNSASYGLLDVAAVQPEFAAVEQGVATTIRALPAVTTGGLTSDNSAALEAIASAIRAHWSGDLLYIANSKTADLNLAEVLAKACAMRCEVLRVPHLAGYSAATLGLQKASTKGAPLPLTLEVRAEVNTGTATPRAMPWKWAAVAALLGIVMLGLRYAEVFIKKPALAQRLTAINNDRQRLPAIDRELTFLQHLETNQAPYLNALLVIANAAAPGTRIESFSMTRRGDLAIRGMMQNAQQATDFRAKLVDSGLFSSVVLEEQTPGPDRQRLSVRLSARWKHTKDAKLDLPEKKATPAPSQNPAAPRPAPAPVTLRPDLTSPGPIQSSSANAPTPPSPLPR